jgi:hypothetical protein
MKFEQRLLLNQYLLSLLNARTFDNLAQDLRNDQSYEQVDEEGRTGFYHVLVAKLSQGAAISRDLLATYDENIVRHTRTISRKRGETIRWKYFQYLALLFTEIYLDRFFHNPKGLLQDLNNLLETFNAETAQEDRLPAYAPDDLRKICYWMATGSGKTLIMHMNILQYHHYLRLAGNGNQLNRVILLTPNEGLSIQHLDEMHASGFVRAEIFQKDYQMRLPTAWDTPAVDIIDIHKLREEAGEKTVAIETFEGGNLVLVDEGHLGASGEEWLDKRDRLCADGFSFEYSATFGQAMKASRRKELTEKYAKTILFDYSYKFFHRDGYGKNYWILNLPDEKDDETRKLYLTGCLLTFYQQQRLYLDKSPEFRLHNLEAPLWVFVGSSVSAVRTEHKRKVSDVVDILLFLADFVKNKEASLRRLQQLLSGRSNILDSRDHDVFASAFPYLVMSERRGIELYADILSLLFNAKATGALHVEMLKGIEGELALRIADNEPFGVINVGDAPALKKLCQQHPQLVVSEGIIMESLFFKIKESDSHITVLIGSKKFTEGWNSYRVSTMGLMNVGRAEGPEIIQLFGRGVRLRGLDNCLKRSNHLTGVQPPRHLRLLETLDVFGIRANYMRQFKEYLEEEGVPTEGETTEFVLPTRVTISDIDKLKFLELDKNVDFRRDAPRPILDSPTEAMKRYPIPFNWYPKLQAEHSQELRELDTGAVIEEGRITESHIAFLDWDAIFWDLEKYKSERGWYNLRIPYRIMRSLLRDPSWYRLFIPLKELEIDSFEKAKRLQELASAMLKRYVERYYMLRKDEWERKHLRLVRLKQDSEIIPDKYRFLVEASKDEIVAKLREIERAVRNNDIQHIEQFGALQPILFSRHIYQPLIHLDRNGITVTPAALNDGERDFVIDLQKFYNEHCNFFHDKDLYLLRNRGRGKGLGFFAAGGFYPDFILWLVKGNLQHIAVVEPHGMILTDEDHPKIRFHATIKELEERFKGDMVTLDSFIVSPTRFERIEHVRKLTKEQFEEQHVLFLPEDENRYIETILTTMMKS